MTVNPDDLPFEVRELYHAAHQVAYHGKDRHYGGDLAHGKAFFWLELGKHIEALFQAIEKFDDWERQQKKDREPVELKERSTGRRRGRTTKP